MAVTIPPIFSGIHDNEVKYTASVQEETTRKMVQDMNFFGELAKIGSIRAVQLNQPGVAAPDPTILMLCDGDEITNPNSPLRTMGLTQRFAPDLVSKYLRGATTATLNPSGGDATINLSHNHSGQTGSVSGTIRGEEGDERTARVPHSHPINADLSAATPLEVAHQQIAFYLKIT